MESEHEMKRRIEKTIAGYETTVKQILSQGLAAFVEYVSSEKNFGKLDNLRKAFEWEMKKVRYKKKEEQGVEHRRDLGKYLAPLRERINVLKRPLDIPESDQRYLTGKKGDII